MVTGRYAQNGYRASHGVQPASALAALALSAAMVSGLVMSSPAVQKRIYKTFIGTAIPLAQPEPEPKPEMKPVVQTKVIPNPLPKHVDTPPPLVPTDDGSFTVTQIPLTPGGTGLDPITIIPPQPASTPAPVLTGAAIDPRYARDFQPLYPASEERAGREGLVSVRVLVGTDGRVRRIEKVAAASDAFWTATQRQALSHWRFRPATRNGVPIEAWREMTVRFVMPE